MEQVETKQQIKKDIDTSKYTKMKSVWEKKYNDFPMGFAFSEEQLKQQLEKLGVKSKDDVVGIGIGGGFIRKTDVEDFNKMVKEVHDEQIKAREDDEYLYQMFVYEMGNCEYQLTYDTEYVLEMGCCMSAKDLEDVRVAKIWLKAKRDFIDMCNANDWY